MRARGPVVVVAALSRGAQFTLACLRVQNLGGGTGGAYCVRREAGEEAGTLVAECRAGRGCVLAAGTAGTCAHVNPWRKGPR